MPTTSTKSSLPKRFLPLLEQVKTEAGLRYGAQEAAFGTLLGQLAKDRDRQLMAQKTAQQSLLGSMQASDTNVNRYYSDAGLSPTVLSSLAGTPTGARLAGEMAGYRSANQQALLGAQAGGQYQQQRINQEFGDQLGALNSQVTAEQKERGLFTQSALNQLISSDRSTRHAANEAARQQQHDDLQAQIDRRHDSRQAQLDRDTSTSNTALGQGYAAQVNEDGSISLVPIPGGKADPAAKPHKRSKPTGADRTIQGDYKKASSWVKQLDSETAKTQRDPAKRRQIVEELLIKGDQLAGIPSITSVGLDAALDMYYDQALSGDTVSAIHNANAKVKFLNGVRTQAQRRDEQRTLPMGGRRGTAKSRDQQLG